MNKLYSVIFVCSASCVLNQTKAEEYNFNNTIEDTVTKPLLGSIVRADNALQVTAGSDKEKVTLTIAPKNTKRFSLTLSAPLEDKKTSANLYSSETNAFADSTTFGMNYRFNLIDDEDQLFSKIIETQNVAIYINNRCYNTPTEFNIKKDKDTKQADIREACNNLKFDEKVKRFKKNTGSEEIDFLIPTLFEDIKFNTWGFGATYGRQEYKYFDNTSPVAPDDDGNNVLNTLSSTENPWGVNVYFQQLKVNDYAWWLELAYQEGYKAQDDEVRCLNSSNDIEVIQGCMSSQSDAPQENTNINLTFGYRGKLLGTELPFSFESTYDFEDDERSHSLPIYFIKDTKSKWNAGVRWDYDSGKTGSTFAFFIGSSFKLSAK